MIRINLLSITERFSRLLPVKYIPLTIGIMFLGASLIFAAFGHYQIWDLKLQTAQIEQKKLMLRPTAVNMEIASQKQAEIAAKTNILLSLTAERVSWHSLLSRLSDIIPPQVWLTEVSAKNNSGNRDNNNAIINLKGKALTYPDIIAFMQKIEQDEYLLDAVLVKAEKDGSFDGSQFEITVRMKKF